MARIYALVHETTADKFPRLYLHLCNHIRFDTQPGRFLDTIFASLFAQQLSLDAVTRLWDIWVFEGDAVLVRAMVALFGVLETRLSAADSAEEIFAVMKEGTDVGEEDWIMAVRDAGR